MSSKTVGLRETNGIQPKLGNAVTMLNMDVRRLRSFKTVKEEAKAGDPQDSRHGRSPRKKYVFSRRASTQLDLDLYENGDPGWIRTSDLQLRRLLLYPLSYGAVVISR
jgi:hypothetical protein